MKLLSIQGRFALLFIAFFLLVIVSVGVTFRSLETQKQDVIIINLSGRQRMLVQQMTRETLEIGMGEGESHAQILAESIQTYDQTLKALRDGGPAPYLPGQEVTIPPAQNSELLAQLALVSNTWQSFRSSLETILAQPFGSAAFKSAMLQVESLSPELVQQSDAAVRMFEAGSTQNLAYLRWIQAAFLACALLLLAAGAWMVRKSVIIPLQNLGRAARRIGAGDLISPVEVTEPEEIQVLQENFEQMRLQLLSAQEEAQTWTASLEQRVTQRTQELEAVYTVSREISSRLAIDDVLSSITQKTKELLDSDVVFLCLLDEPGRTMILNATSGPEEAIVQCTSPMYNTSVITVLGGERALRCDEQGCRDFCEILASSYRASHLAAPLKIERQIIGALCVGSEQPGKFGEEAIEVLTKLANVAAVALQNAQLYDQAERLATSEERQRIAAEIHDGLAQMLSYIKLRTDQAALQIETGRVDEAMSTLEQIHSSLDQAIEDTRQAIANLQARGPVNDMLQDQLARLTDEFAGASPTVAYTSSIQVPVLLSRQESEQVLRVTREAILNALRHSRANRIDLYLGQLENEYAVTVEDNGVGFDLEAPADGDGRQHFGLNIMRARAARLNGRIEIQSAPGAGTRLILYWPARVEAR